MKDWGRKEEREKIRLEPSSKRSLPYSRLTHSFASQHIKHWIKTVLQDSWQLQGGRVRTAKTLFKQILAGVYFKCSTKPESKRIFQCAMGVHPTVGNGTTRTGTCSAHKFLPGKML